MRQQRSIAAAVALLAIVIAFAGAPSFAGTIIGPQPVYAKKPSEPPGKSRAKPTPQPTPRATPKPTPRPTVRPTPRPTARPAPRATTAPTRRPTASPETSNATPSPTASAVPGGVAGQPNRSATPPVPSAPVSSISGPSMVAPIVPIGIPLAILVGGGLWVALMRRRRQAPAVTVMRPVTILDGGDLLLQSFDQAAGKPRGTDDEFVANWVKRLDTTLPVMTPPRSAEVVGAKDEGSASD